VKDRKRKWRELAKDGSAVAGAGAKVLADEVKDDYLNWDRGSQLEMAESILELARKLLELERYIYKVEWDIFKEEHPEQFSK
jgi:hypothetical protein